MLFWGLQGQFSLILDGKDQNKNSECVVLDVMSKHVLCCVMLCVSVCLCMASLLAC